MEISHLITLYGLQPLEFCCCNCKHFTVNFPRYGYNLCESPGRGVHYIYAPHNTCCADYIRLDFINRTAKEAYYIYNGTLQWAIYNYQNKKETMPPEEIAELYRNYYFELVLIEKQYDRNYTRALYENYINK